MQAGQDQRGVGRTGQIRAVVVPDVAERRGAAHTDAEDDIRAEHARLALRLRGDDRLVPAHKVHARRRHGRRPVNRIIPVERGQTFLQGRPAAVRRRRPRRAVVVAHLVDGDVADAVRARGVGLLQLQPLAAVLQVAGVRRQNLHAGRHRVTVGELHDVGRHEEEQPAGRQREVGREVIAQSIHSPGVGRKCGVEKRHGVAADVLQFNKLQLREDRVVMNLGDDHRPDARSGVGRAGGRCELRRELRLTRADEIAAKGFPIRRRVEAEPVVVAGQVRVHVPGEEIHVVAVGIEREAAVRAGRGVKIRLVEHQVTERCEHRAVGDAEFFRHRRVVGEEPAAEVHHVGGGIKQLDEVHAGFAVGQNFIDEHGRHGERRIVRAGRAAQRAARAPVFWIAEIRIGVRVDRHEREIKPVRRHRPGREIAVSEGQHLRAERMRKRDRLAAVGEASGVEAIHCHAGVPAREGGRIAGEDEELAGGQLRAHGKGEGEAGEIQPAQAERALSRVLQFQEFKLVTVGQPHVGRVIHDFGDEQFAQILRRIKRHLVDRAPHPGGENAGADRGGGVDDERAGISQRRGGHAAALHTGIAAVERVVKRAGGIAVGHAKAEPGGNRAADGVEGGRVDRRVKSIRLKLANDDGGASIDETHDGVHRADPGVARVGRAGAFRVTPAGGLGNDGALDFVAPAEERGAHARDGKRAVVEAMFEDAVGGQHAELRILVHAEPDVLRSGAQSCFTGPAGLGERIAAGPVGLNNPVGVRRSGVG